MVEALDEANRLSPFGAELRVLGVRFRHAAFQEYHDWTMWFYEHARIWIEWLSRGVELTAALIITLAAAEAALKAFRLFGRRDSPPAMKNEVRLTLGRWLAVGLEFELAADILRTALTPTWNDIGQLAAIATLRTALNYFLAKEIEKDSTREPASAG